MSTQNVSVCYNKSMITIVQEILNVLLIQGSARRGLSGGGVVRQVAVMYPSVQNAFARINISIVIPSKQTV